MSADVREETSTMTDRLGHPKMGVYRNLRLSVSLLSADAAEQIEWLEQTRLPVSELAQQVIDDVPAWTYHFDLSPQQKASIDQLEAALEALQRTATPSFWSRSALMDGCQWAEIRRLAAITLSSVGGSPPPARLDTIDEGADASWRAPD